MIRNYSFNVLSTNFIYAIHRLMFTRFSELTSLTRRVSSTLISAHVLQSTENITTKPAVDFNYSNPLLTLIILTVMLLNPNTRNNSGIVEMTNQILLLQHLRLNSAQSELCTNELIFYLCGVCRWRFISGLVTPHD